MNGLLQMAAGLSLVLPLPAAAVVAGRAARDGGIPLRVLYGAIAYAALVIVPLQAEAALELLGLIDRLVLLGPAVASGAVLLVAALRGSGFGSIVLVGGSRAPWPAGERLPRSIVAAAVVVAGVYGLFALERLLAFPITWDSVHYHLPVVAGWLRRGSLALPADPHYYEAIPASADLFSLLALGTGWYGLAEVWNLVSTAAAAGGTHLLARVVGAGRRGSAVAALVVVGTPMVLHQSFSAYVDLFVGGFLAASIALAAAVAMGRAAGERPRWAMAGSGLACGIAVGAKATAWPVALLICVAVAAWLVFSSARRADRWTLLGLFAAAVAVPGMFWFVRNWATTGNPGYPLEIAVFGRTLFEGTNPAEITLESYTSTNDLLRELAYWLTYPWSERKWAGYPYSVGSGLGPLVASLAVPGVLVSLWRLRPGSGAGRIGGTDRRGRLALAAGLMVLVACWWFVLSPVWRFGLLVIVLAPALAASSLDDFSRRLPRFFATILLAATVVFAAFSALPRASSLAHQARYGEWDWASYYHLPPAARSLPGDTTVVNVDFRDEGWNNFSLLGRELQHQIVPDWKVKSAVAAERPLDICPAFVVDRAPFDIPGEQVRFERGTLRLVAETDAQHGDTRWRIWKLDGCAGTERPNSTESPSDG